MRTLSAQETGGGIIADQILLTSGAAQALFIISTTLLEPGDEMIVIRPNYATNLETPRAIGANLKIVDLTFEKGWKIDPTALESQITSKTKFVSITVPHNPTGTVMSADDLKTLVQITDKHGCRLLVDETYREMNFNGTLPYAATLAPHVISVASFSKTFGLPGIRVGWLMTRDEKLFEQFFAAKEQIQICGSALDEEIACQFYRKRGHFISLIFNNLQRRFTTLKNWMESQEYLEWVEPTGGCVAFPRINAAVLSRLDLEKFYRTLNREYSTHVGPGHWFEQPKHFMRIGYGWPTDEALSKGLRNIESAIRAQL